MRIIELCLGKGLGGLELYFRKCCEVLCQDHHVVVVTKNNTRLADLSDAKDEHHYQVQHRVKHFPLASIRKLISIINKESIDLIHVHHKDDLPLVIWAKYLSKTKVKVVHTRQMQLPGSKKDLYHTFIYRGIDFLIAITDQLRREAEKKLPIDHAKIGRLYYGVEKADRTQLDNSFIVNPGQFNIGVFSRIEHQKGQHLVIEAANKLLKTNNHYDIYFIGDVMIGEYQKHLESQIEDESRGHFHFKGFHTQPLSVMPLFDLIIMPSKNETFGLVLAEAMRAGVAVIATNSGGVPEIVDNGKEGLLFEWGNHDQLAQNIEKLYKQPEIRKNLALSGEQKADRLFNTKLHFDKLIEIFEQVVKN
ncbi:glycosyltransferase family 4 protein [Fulvivirga sp. M361]|uniref:glycosyltransferase family 4 protein n=1 Tax=Fulvivirga sp. M361 TaxID=2594266 RepID=UPI001179EE38|nr:glycosyltransferase family 4 protein [Fulvivirga sp. M361]TRX60867.1 glycosyltransferase family 4 protein [Fulvivirga sp. M361]